MAIPAKVPATSLTWKARAVPIPDPRAMKERKAARRKLRHALAEGTDRLAIHLDILLRADAPDDALHILRRRDAIAVAIDDDARSRARCEE